MGSEMCIRDRIRVVVSVVGTHVFPRVKCTHTPRLRTAYDMIHSYYSTTILCTKPSANDLLTFSARRCQHKLSRRRACCSSECTNQTDLSATRLLLTWPPELFSMDFPHTAVLETMYERRCYCGYSQKYCQSVLRVRLQISRGERRVAVQAGRSRTESNGRQNHAEVSQAEIPGVPLTES